MDIISKIHTHKHYQGSNITITSTIANTNVLLQFSNLKCINHPENTYYNTISKHIIHDLKKYYYSTQPALHQVLLQIQMYYYNFQI